MQWLANSEIFFIKGTSLNQETHAARTSISLHELTSLMYRSTTIPLSTSPKIFYETMRHSFNRPPKQMRHRVLTAFHIPRSRHGLQSSSPRCSICVDNLQKRKVSMTRCGRRWCGNEYRTEVILLVIRKVSNMLDDEKRYQLLFKRNSV